MCSATFLILLWKAVEKLFITTLHFHYSFDLFIIPGFSLLFAHPHVSGGLLIEFRKDFHADGVRKDYGKTN